MATRNERGGIAESVTDTWTVLVAYVRQETVEPLRGIFRRVGLGMLGAVIAGVGAIELVLALLRLLQEETGDAFDGNWSWVPYVITLVVVGIVTAAILWYLDHRRSQAPDRT